jgi:hypothetical protein
VTAVARSRKSSVTTVSLFPFLSVLSSIIGVLALIIVCMAVGQLESGTGSKAEGEIRAAKERGEEHARLSQELEAAARAALPRLREELRKLEEVLEKAPAIKIQPRGLGKDLRPLFVEARKEELYLHARKQSVRWQEIPTSKAFRELLERTTEEADPRAIVVFLIRPDGVQTFLEAEAEATRRKARHGKLPVPGPGPIDLSLFDEAP